MASHGQFPHMQLPDEMDTETSPVLEPSQLDNRWDMQEILPSIFLGPFTSASKGSLRAMRAAGLTHVVCVRSKEEEQESLLTAQHSGYFKYIFVRVDEYESIIPKIKIVSEFIDNCLIQGGKVLVYGNTGLDNAPAFVIGYIMSRGMFTYEEAVKIVRRKRPCIENHYEMELTAFETICAAQHQIGTAPWLKADMSEPSEKRKTEENEEVEQQATTKRKRADDEEQMDLDSGVGGV